MTSFKQIEANRRNARNPPLQTLIAAGVLIQIVALDCAQLRLEIL